MDNWLIKPKRTYEQVVAKLAKVESELATLKEANAKRGTSSVDKALKELNVLKEKSRWAAEIATACGLAPEDCPEGVIEFGAALDSSTNDIPCSRRSHSCSQALPVHSPNTRPPSIRITRFGQQHQ